MLGYFILNNYLYIHAKQTINNQTLVLMELDLANLTDAHQDRMCQLCEDNEICYSRSTCEGSYCERALDYLIDELENEEEERIKEIIEAKLGDKFRELYKLLGI